LSRHSDREIYVLERHMLESDHHALAENYEVARTRQRGGRRDEGAFAPAAKLIG
jgi:hypothetical protein